MFSTDNVSFLYEYWQSLAYGFVFSVLRQSAGTYDKILITVEYLRMLYGVPLNAEDDNPNRFLRDDLERFQIAIGVDF